MIKQEYHIYTNQEPDGWYTYVHFPQEEEGSVRRIGPLSTEVEADEKFAEVLEIVTKAMGDRVKSVNMVGKWEN